MERTNIMIEGLHTEIKLLKRLILNQEVNGYFNIYIYIYILGNYICLHNFATTLPTTRLSVDYKRLSYSIAQNNMIGY